MEGRLEETLANGSDGGEWKDTDHPRFIRYSAQVRAKKGYIINLRFNVAHALMIEKGTRLLITMVRQTSACEIYTIASLRLILHGGHFAFYKLCWQAMVPANRIGLKLCQAGKCPKG